MITVLLVILAVAFAAAGSAKLAGVPFTVDNFAKWPIPSSTRVPIGLIEVGIAVLAVIGCFSDGVAIVAAALALCTMVGALITHARSGDKPAEVLPAVVLLAISIVVVATV